MKYKFLYFLLLMLSLTACAPPVYFASGFRGQVIDEQTGQPLEKVIVIAIWEAGGVGFGDTGLDQRLRVYEAITDSQGYFTIPSGLALRNPFTRAPEGAGLYGFKSGYLAGFVSGYRQPYRLKPLSEDMSIELQASRLATIFDNTKDNSDPKDWKKYPRLLLAVSAEVQRLASMGASLWILPSTPDIDSFSKEDKQFLARFRNEM